MKNKSRVSAQREAETITQLLADLAWLESGLHLHSPEFLRGLKDLRDQMGVESAGFTLTSASHRKTKGKTSILHVFCNIFDPIVQREIFSGVMRGDPYLSELLGPNLRSSLLDRSQCRPLADKIKKAIKYLEGHPSQLTNTQEIIQMGEGLQCLVTLLDRLDAAFDAATPIEWCRICFRRAAYPRQHCENHKSDGDDTAYRKGKKIARKIPEEVRCKWEQWRNERRDGAMPLASWSSYVHPWPEVAKEWDSFVLSECKAVAGKLGSSAGSFSSWKDFVDGLVKKLADDHEHTSHPYYILRLIQCADYWFNVEDNFIDGRKSSRSKNRCL